MTVLGMLPEITEPDFVIELATITVIVGATVGGGEREGDRLGRSAPIDVDFRSCFG